VTRNIVAVVTLNRLFLLVTDTMSTFVVLIVFLVVANNNSVVFLILHSYCPAWRLRPNTSDCLMAREGMALHAILKQKPVDCTVHYWNEHDKLLAHFNKHVFNTSL